MKAAEYRLALAKAQTEKDFGLQIEELVTRLGLRYYHTHRSQHSVAGFPDYVIISPRGRGMMYRELKREGNKPTAEQDVWLTMLSANGCDTGVWRPSDLLSGRVLRELRTLT